MTQTSKPAYQPLSAEALRDAMTYALFEGSRVAKVVVGEDRLIYAANQAFCDLVGYELHELYLKPSNRFTHKADRERHEAERRPFWNGEANAMTIRERYHRKTGEVIWVQIDANELVDVAGHRYALAELQNVTAEVEAAAALRENEHRLQLLLDGQEDGMWDWTVATGEVYYSPSYCRMLGVPASEVAPVLRTWAERVHPEDWTRVMEALEPHLEGRTPLYVVEFRIRCHDGSWKWVLNRGRVVERAADGRAVRMLGTMADVTARHETQEALDESQHFNHVLLDSSSDCIKLLNVDGRVDYINRRGLALIGAESLAEIGKDNWVEWWPDSERARIADALEIARNGGVGQFQGLCQTLDGVNRWWDVTITAVFGARGEVRRLLCICRDITEQRQTEERLRESEMRFRRIAERAPVGIFLDDPTGTPVYANPRLAMMFGMPERELLQGEWRRLLHPADKPMVMRIRQRFIDDDQDYAAAEHRVVRPDGVVRHVQVEYVRLRGADGSTEGYAGIVDDLTDRLAMEEQVRQRQKLEAVGQLAGGIAHDFNNLLTVISTYGEFIRDERDLSMPARMDLDELLAAAARAASLTRQLLAFSRKQKLQIQGILPSNVVLGMREMLGRVLGEKYIVETSCEAATHCQVLADRGQLEQVVLNLALNARDAMPDGGKLSIATRCDRIGGSAPNVTGELRINEPPGEYVVLRVSDDGVGMDAATQRQMFEPFFTTKPAGQGTGLGLATVYGIVTQSNGFIRVQSALGEGTTVEVWLPKVLTDSAEPQPVDEGATSTGEKAVETILVVEDELAVRRSLQRLLGRAGYSVIEARNGKEGLAQWREHRERIDLVLTDLVMPEMGGAELALLINREKPGARMVFLSGYASDEVHALLDRDATIVEKPFDGKALLRVLRDALN